MATTNLGRVAIVAQGEYNPSTQYEKLDIVRYAEVSYLVLRAVKGVVPTDGADYSLLAGRGESAYEVAVDNGYVGTEQDWLAYIRADGSISALQKFMTNDASTEVSVPEYGNIPSLQGYISQMFENGGLPATPFATKALMTASALVDGKYALVTDGGADNGLYLKTAGVWVKSEYDVYKKTTDYLNTIMWGKKRIGLKKGYISTSGDYVYNDPYAVSVSKTRVFPDDKLVIEGDVSALTDYRYLIVRYGLDGSFISRSTKYSRSPADRVLDLFDGYLNVVVESAEVATTKSLAEREASFYIKANKLTRDYLEVGSDIKAVTVSLDLEIGYLEKTKIDSYSDVGRINNARDLTESYDFLASRRTPKFLNVVGGTDFSTIFDDGTCRVFEYDSNFDCLGFFEVASGDNYQLAKSTRFIKFSLEGVVAAHPSLLITYKSSKDSPEFTKNTFKTNVGQNINFTYEVQPNKGLEIYDNVDSQQYSGERYFNTALLKLPPNYDPNNSPSRLIIFVQGSQGYLSFAHTTASTSYESYGVPDRGIFNYLQKEGYAVLSVYPWTSRFPLPGSATNAGTPTAMAAYAQAYKWVVDNYNIRQDGVFVTGKSSGGYCGAMLSFNMGIPVLATGLLAPVLSPINAGFGPNYPVRKALAEDFGFEGSPTVMETAGFFATEEFKSYARLNGHKMIGYNPFWAGVINEDVEALIESGLDGSDIVFEAIKHRKRVCPVPFKIWCAVDDDVKTYETSRAFIQSIRNANGTAEMRTMPNGTGGHSSVDTASNAIRVSEITTRLGYKHYDVPLAVAELVQYFRRFG